jgi:hypothetical protein
VAWCFWDAGLLTRRIVIIGEAYFSYDQLPGNVRPIGSAFDNPEFPNIPSHPAGSLPVTYADKPVLKPNSNKIKRKLTATWNCCEGDGKTKVKIE